MNIANVVLGDVGCKPNWSRFCVWLKTRSPNIVTLQKIGSSEPFPEDALCKSGYESWFLDHDRYYRGVAVLVQHDFLSRHDLPSPKVRDCELWGDDRNESRFLTLSIGNLSISSVYAPYDQKARVPWLNGLRNHVDKEGYAQLNTLLCGDFNVKFRADGPYGTGYSKAHQDVLESLMSLGFRDLYREKNPNEKGHTRGYDKKPKGTSRLHLILASARLAQSCRNVRLDDNPALWPRTSAPPLIADLDVEP